MTQYRKKTALELAKEFRTLLQVSNNLESVDTEVGFQGVAFTVVVATLTLPKTGRQIIGEGVTKKSFIDKNNEDCGWNIAAKRALEALDKKLRRVRPFVGHRYEG